MQEQEDTTAHERAERFGRAAYLYVTVVVAGFGYLLFRMPFQLSDNLGNMLNLQADSFWGLIESSISARGYLRPLMWGHYKIPFDLAGGEYFLVFRSIHVALFLILVALFVRLLRIRSALDLAVVPLATAVLIGIHTFEGTVREAFPINHFMLVIVYCLVALNLAASRPAWWKDVAAALAFFLAVFTIESGVLVWAVTLAAYAVGFRGVSRRGLAASTAVLLFYLLLRFVIFDVGSPQLLERASGFGFARLEPAELIERFGDDPKWFYAYNVLCSGLTVLFSEPRNGQWVLLDNLFAGRLALGVALNVLASVLLTLCVGRFVVRKWRWRPADLDYEGRLCAVFLGLLAANAMISYPYTKDVVMSVAGVLYAVVAFLAVRDLLARGTGDGWPQAARGWALAAALLVASSSWAVRVAGLDARLAYSAMLNRQDWALADDYIAEQKAMFGTPAAARLIDELRAEVVATPVPNLYAVPSWLVRFFDPTP